MASKRTTFTLDDELADQARRLDVNISAEARQGAADAVRAALAQADRAAYERQPERLDSFWDDVEEWGEHFNPLPTRHLQSPAAATIRPTPQQITI